MNGCVRIAVVGLLAVIAMLLCACQTVSGTSDTGYADSENSGSENLATETQPITNQFPENQSSAEPTSANPDSLIPQEQSKDEPPALTTDNTQSETTTEPLASANASAIDDEQAEVEKTGELPDAQGGAPATMGFIPTKPMKTGVLQQAALSEVSGLAASRRYPDILWAINDSGNAARIYAIDHTGKAKGNFKIAESNRDWEDLAAATINGEHYLLIADIGDNLRVKNKHKVTVIAEPLLGEADTDVLQPIYSLEYSYPNGKHNAEALAYANGYIYVLTKAPLLNGKRQASRVFRIPLNLNANNDTLVAEEIAQLAIPPKTIESSLIASIGGVDVSQPTAFDIDVQNRHAYVLTYRSIYHYTRSQDESWSQALSQTRVRIHSHSLSQAEALAVNNDNVIWFTSERRPAPLWAMPGLN